MFTWGTVTDSKGHWKGRVSWGHNYDSDFKVLCVCPHQHSKTEAVNCAVARAHSLNQALQRNKKTK